MNHADNIASLTHCRDILLSITAGFSSDDLHRRFFPDSKTIGEILLHIAGFEFITIAAVEGQLGVRPDHDLWQRLKHGFAREAGFPPPSSVRLSEHLDALGQVRARTMDFFTRHPDSLVEHRLINIPDLAGELGSHDTDTDPIAYRRLQQGVATSFANDGPIVDGDKVDVPDLLRLHETYHRGQITFQTYLMKKLAESGSGGLASTGHA